VPNAKDLWQKQLRKHDIWLYYLFPLRRGVLYLFITGLEAPSSKSYVLP